MLPITLWGQKNVLELVKGSELLGYNEKTGAHRLVRQVSFIYQGNTMYSDSAHYFQKTKEVRAYGNVHITKGGINLFCDSLYYNGKTRKARLWGHVRVRDVEYKLTTDSLDYDTKLSQGVYRTGGRVENSTNDEVLTSKIGYFYPRANSFFFSQNVVYRKKDLSMTTDTLQFIYAKQTTYFFGPTNIKRGSTKMFCKKGWYNVETKEGRFLKAGEIFENGKHIKGDTLFYQPHLGQSVGRGHVYFKDSLQAMSFSGDYARYSSAKNHSMIVGHTLATKVQRQDTLYIHADTLFNQNDSLGKPLFSLGYRNVKLFNRGIQSICDSITFDAKAEIMQLYKKPIVWSNNAELKGELMTILIKDSVIHHISILTKASVVMELDSGAYFNQIEGKQIEAFFKENDLVRTDVIGNARTIFYPRDEKTTDSSFVIKRLGMNRLYASELKIYLDSGEIKNITYFDKPDGIFYPMDKINKDEQYISTFKWQPLLRPKNWMEIVH